MYFLSAAWTLSICSWSCEYNVIEPSIYRYITDIIVVMRFDGLEYVGVGECVIAVVGAGYL